MSKASLILPLEIWLIVFDFIQDCNVLWSGVRNVSNYLRACVDEHFRITILPNCLVFLIYSTIHTAPGPWYVAMHMPMQFTRLAEGGTHAVFRQMQLKHGTLNTRNGSVRGWLPFVERYHEEIGKPAPRAISKGPRTGDIPLWEQEHIQLRTTLEPSDKSMYLNQLSGHICIGRGDRPPYFIRLAKYAHDTELVDLVIDCDAREVSFDWRQTLSAFFMERQFMVLARPGKMRVHDKALDSAAKSLDGIPGDTRFKERHLDQWRRARRKRLRTWVARNKHRMSNEHRLMVEDRVEISRQFILSELCSSDNMIELPGENMGEEIVPVRCADDHTDLMMWPWAADNAWFSARRYSHCRKEKRCIVLQEKTPNPRSVIQNFGVVLRRIVLSFQVSILYAVNFYRSCLP